MWTSNMLQLTIYSVASSWSGPHTAQPAPLFTQWIPTVAYFSVTAMSTDYKVASSWKTHRFLSVAYYPASVGYGKK